MSGAATPVARCAVRSWESALASATRGGGDVTIRCLNGDEVQAHREAR